MPEKLREETTAHIEKNNLRVVDTKTYCDEEIIKHVWPNLPERFLADMLSFYRSGSTKALMIRGDHCIKICTKIKQQLRQRYQVVHPKTMIHASDNPMKADREIFNVFYQP